MVDFDKINKLRKIRDEIDELIDAEINQYEPIHYQPIQPISPTPIYISPSFPVDRRPYKWEITCTN